MIRTFNLLVFANETSRCHKSNPYLSNGKPARSQKGGTKVNGLGNDDNRATQTNRNINRDKTILRSNHLIPLATYPRRGIKSVESKYDYLAIERDSSDALTVFELEHWIPSDIIF